MVNLGYILPSNHGPYVYAVPEKRVHIFTYTGNVKTDLTEG